MAPRRLDPRLVAAFERAQVAPEEPLDFDTPGRVVEVPVPAEHFAQPQAPAPKSRLDVVREYLEAQGQAQLPDLGPEPDMRAAMESDARRNFGRSMLAAGAAFGGNPDAILSVKHDNSAERTAAGMASARRKALADWAATQDKRRLDEAELLSRAASQQAPVDRTRELDIKQQGVDLQRESLDFKREMANRPKAPKGGKGTSDGKTLPVSEVGELSSLPVAEAQVDRLAEEFKRLDMGGTKGRVGGAITDALGLRWTDSAEYNAAASLAMQAAGKIMEGGKLAAGDEMKYRQMLPRPGDSDDVVKQKVAGMKEFLRSLAQARAKGLQESGYNVPASLFPKAAADAPQDENAKALAWANAHPDDPRSAAIKARLGVK